MQLLLEKLQQHVRAKDEKLFAEQLFHVHDFGDWLKPLGVHLSNAFVSREGRSAVHSFTYKVRTDLSTSDVAKLPRSSRRHTAHGEDVFALTKGRMHMTKTKAPVLALPHSSLSSVTTNQPAKLMDFRETKKAQKNELQKLHDQLQTKMATINPRTIKLLKDILAGAGGSERSVPDLDWLLSGPRCRQPVEATHNVYYEHLPDTSWNLLASFRRKAHADVD